MVMVMVIDHAVHLLRPYTGHSTDAVAEAKLSFVLAVIVRQALRHTAGYDHLIYNNDL